MPRQTLAGNVAVGEVARFEVAVGMWLAVEVMLVLVSISLLSVVSTRTYPFLFRVDTIFAQSPGGVQWRIDMGLNCNKRAKAVQLI